MRACTLIENIAIHSYYIWMFEDFRRPIAVNIYRRHHHRQVNRHHLCGSHTHTCAIEAKKTSSCFSFCCYRLSSLVCEISVEEHQHQKSRMEAVKQRTHARLKNHKNNDDVEYPKTKTHTRTLTADPIFVSSSHISNWFVNEILMNAITHEPPIFLIPIMNLLGHRAFYRSLCYTASLTLYSPFIVIMIVVEQRNPQPCNVIFFYI